MHILKHTIGNILCMHAEKNQRESINEYELHSNSCFLSTFYDIGRLLEKRLRKS